MANQSTGSRIPVALQEVFLASNRGKEVHAPPPGIVAFRMFQSTFQRSNKPQTPPTTAATTTTTYTRGLFGRKNVSIRPIGISNIDKHSRRAHDETTCPIRDISFQVSSPTQSLHTLSNSSAHQATIDSRNWKHLVVDDHSITSSLSFAIVKETKHSTKTKKRDKSTPQSYLDTMVKRHGYSTKRYCAKQTGYYNKATRTQRLSYHVNIVDLAKDGKVDKLRELFATGISTNPANVHGEGLINLVCRLGASDILKVMIDAGCDVQVSDDYGRTPLHDACCCGTTELAFKVVEQILKIDPWLLFVRDDRGALPLSYVKEKDYEQWICLLKSRKHELWPRTGCNSTPKLPPLSLQPPNTRPVPDPRIVLPSAFIGMLASGRMSPDEVTMLYDFDDTNSSSETDDDDDYLHDPEKYTYMESSTIPIQ